MTPLRYALPTLKWWCVTPSACTAHFRRAAAFAGGVEPSGLHLKSSALYIELPPFSRFVSVLNKMRPKAPWEPSPQARPTTGNNFYLRPQKKRSNHPQRNNTVCNVNLKIAKQAHS